MKTYVGFWKRTGPGRVPVLAVVALLILSAVVVPVGTAFEPATDETADDGALSSPSSAGISQNRSTPGEDDLSVTAGGAGSWPALDEGDWGTAGRDPGRSGYNPDTSGPQTDADARWVYEAEEQVRNEPAVVADGRVFVPTRDGLRVLDDETGDRLWNVTDRNVDHVSVSEGVAVVTSSFDDEVRAYDAAAGTELWNQTDFEARSSVVSNGTVFVERYFNTVDEVHLYAFDLHSGTERWSVQHADDVGGGLAAADDTVYATWKLSDGWDREYAVFALNASDGSEHWRFEVEGPIDMHPVAASGTVFVGAGDGTYDPKFYALNATDGHVEWIFDAHTRPNGAAVADGIVHVSIGNGIHALDRTTGERQWIHRMNADVDYGLSYTAVDANAPAVADGAVYATNDRGFVDALDAGTGDVLWTYRVEGQATHPAIADGRVYVHATDPESGENVVRVYALEEPPFDFSGLTPSVTTVAPDEDVTVDVTIENVDDETRAYDLSLMADDVFSNDWRAVDTVSGQLAPGASETVAFATGFKTSGSWDLSIKRAAERESSIGPVTVDVVHSPSVDDWPIRGFDRGATDSNPDTAGPKRHVQERWNASSFDDDTEPIVSDGTAYVVHDQYRSGQPNVHRLATYDFETGTPGWEYNFTAENRVPVGSATVEDGTAYVYTTSRFLYDDAPDPAVGTVYAFDVTDGSTSWSKDLALNRTVTADQAPIVENGLVYVAGGITEENSNNANASVYALNAATGSVDWTHTVGEKSELEYFYPPAFADGTLYVSLSDQDEPNTFDYTESVVAIDASNGDQLWKTVSIDLDQTQQLVVRDGLVYAIDRPGNGNGWVAEELVAYDVSDGSEAWRFTPPNVTTSTNEYDRWRLYKPVVTGDAVYVSQQETESSYSYQRLNRVNASTGDLEWRRSFSDRGSFVVVDGLAYASGYGDRTAIYDADTGEALGSTDGTSGATGATVTVTNGTVFGTADQGQTLRALSEGGAFEFSDLAVDSARLGTGENVTVTATVTNVGALERSWNVNLRVAPSSDRQHHHIWDYPGRGGTLAPGESETITWTVRLDDRGDYVFTLQPNYENSGMSAYLDDLTHGITVSSGDDRDGETIPFVGPREMPAEADSWPKESFDAANTGNNTGTGAPTAVGADVEAWAVNHSYEWTSGPTLANDTVFAGGNHVSGGEFVYAYNATDGSLRWQYQSYGSSDVEIPPTYAGGYVYTAASDGRVYQFDATTGERLWTYNGLQDVTGITVVDDVAYVSGYDYQDSNYLATTHALNASTREVLWTFERVGPSYGANSIPGVLDGTVYVTSEDGNTYAMNATTGAVEWSRPIPGAGSSLHSPVVEDGAVYVDDAAWDSTDASLYALDATDGSTLWSTPANVDGYTGSSPALANETLYFTADGAVRAVDATGGSQLWNTTVCSAARHSPAYADGIVYVPMTDSTVRAYDADTGELVWRYGADDEAAFTPAVVDGRLYATGLENSDGTYSLVALEGGTTDQPKTLFDYSGLSTSSTNVSTGEPVTVSATVENQGDAACEYTADLEVDGTVVETATGTVGTGYNDEDTVAFTHSFSSSGTYDVTIADLPPIEVTVTAPEPDVAVSPPTRDFGAVDLGNSSQRWVQVSNEGTDTLYVFDASITGANATDFSVVSSQSVVYAGDDAYFWIEFEPSSADSKTATLELDTNDPDESTATATLTGTGVDDVTPPEVQVTPTEIDFGDVPVGTSVETTVTVENVGGSALSFDGVTLGSSEFDSFDVVDGGGQRSLNPGESHAVTVAFAPASENPDTATMTVNSDDPSTPTVEVALFGTGVPEAAPDIGVSPTAHFYESVPVDDARTKTFAVSNTGDATLNVTGFTVGGADASEFTVQSAPFTVAPGGTGAFDIEFAPTTLGTKSATVDVESNDADEPAVTIELGGGVVDTTAPDLEIVDVAGSNESGATVYANETVEVAANATDEHSAIDQVVVLLDSDTAAFTAAEIAVFDDATGNWIAVFESAAVPDDGDYSVAAIATDTAGNQNGTSGVQTVIVDRKRPRLGATLSRIDETTAQVHLTPTEPLRTGSVAVTVTSPNGTDTSVPMTATGGDWTGTVTIGENGRYEIDAMGVDRAGNHGIDIATSTYRAIETTNETATVVLEPSGTFIRFNTSDDVTDTFVAITDSRTPLAPLGDDRAGVNFLRAQLGASLADNLTNATIGVPAVESELPRGSETGDVSLSYFNETTAQWESLPTAVETVTIDGTTGDYWVTDVDHFSTYGAVVTDTSAPTLDGISPSGTLAAGTTQTDVRFEYSDDISGVDASAVSVTFDGNPVNGPPLSVTGGYASYTATGLSAGTYTATATVPDEAGNHDTFSHSFTIESASGGGGIGGGGGSGSPVGGSANITVTDIAVSPTEIHPGESVTITVTLENDGEEDGDHVLELLLDGDPIAQESVTVAGGATETITAAQTFDEPGAYTLSAGDRTLPLEVVDAAAVDDDPDENDDSDDGADETDDGTDENDPAGDDESTGDADDDSVPGFGPLAALLAVAIAICLFARARRR